MAGCTAMFLTSMRISPTKIRGASLDSNVCICAADGTGSRNHAARSTYSRQQPAAVNIKPCKPAPPTSATPSAGTGPVAPIHHLRLERQQQVRQWGRKRAVSAPSLLMLKQQMQRKTRRAGRSESSSWRLCGRRRGCRRNKRGWQWCLRFEFSGKPVLLRLPRQLEKTTCRKGHQDGATRLWLWVDAGQHGWGRCIWLRSCWARKGC